MKKYKQDLTSTNTRDINWQDIDTVMMDMDGTLLDLHFDNFFWLIHLPTRYAEIHNTSFWAARKNIERLTKELKGTLNWYSTVYWSKQLTVNIYKLKQEIRHLIDMRPFVYEFLEQLKVAGKKRLLITNAHPESLKLKMNNTKINKFLDAIHTSHEFNYPKESQKFWQALACKETFNPSRTLFIDDSVEILHAANQFGIKYLLGINKPDSKKNRIDITDFNSICYFDEVLPIV